MNKVGILTYHNGFNYGACLQAYALQQIIKRYCQDVDIINFESIDFLSSREMFARHPFHMKEIIKIITRIPYYRSLKRREKRFRQYEQECLKTTPVYRTEKDVIAATDSYDCIVCGSDQIWNLGKAAGPAANLIYFLNFPKKQKRVAYAASFGNWVKEADSRAKEFMPWLRLFDRISVREKSGVDYLHEKGLECEQTIDPTFLLDAEDYDKICSPRLIDDDYILMFGWNVNADLISATKRVQKELQLPVYNIVPPPRGLFSGIARRLDIGPQDFLSMIKHASFVVTNSFHGTAFSTTYQKPYASIVSGSPDTRMKSLLDQLGLSDHLVSADAFNVADLMKTDYSDVQRKKELVRESSLRFIKCAMEK